MSSTINLTDEESYLLNFKIKFENKQGFSDTENAILIDVKESNPKMLVKGKQSVLPIFTEDFLDLLWRMDIVKVENAFNNLKTNQQYFIAQNDEHGYFLIDTQGFSYCRYLIKLFGFIPMNDEIILF